jgi:K+/H+ antiporter YhaU regulatory subunit KhtT
MEDVTTRHGVIQKLSVILDYHNNMGVVDRHDGQLQSYQFGSRMSKEVLQEEGWNQL